ncbi:MAG TPA: ADOP family duplicated permease [Vicinamibacterales bacterium]|nr:ADOP family duplicated permease [Vicinamibacterales bacterium]
MSPRVLLSRLLDPLFRARRDRRLNDEVRLHLDLLAEEFEAKGLSPEEARSAARRAFGGVDQVAMRYRDQRGLPLVESIAQDARFAGRSLTRDRGFAITTVLVLALGIGVNNMMFTILYTHTLRSLPVAGADRVVFVSTRDERNTDRGLSWLEFDETRQAVGGTALAAFATGPAALADADRAPERVERSHVTGQLFDVLRIAPIIGRVITVEDDRPGAPPVAVVSESIWKASFGGDRSVLGHDVSIDGSPATIVGVIADRSGFPASSNVWQPLASSKSLDRDDRAARVLRVVGRVREDQRMDEAMAEVRTVGDRLSADHPDASRGIHTRVVTINERFLGRASDPAWAAFMAVGFLVLLIAAANAAHLMIARGLQRAREVAIRASLGASRWRLFRQLLLESSLLAAVGGAIGLGFAVAGVRLFRQGIPAGILPYWMDYAIDARVLAALVGVSAITAVLAGTVPALQACRADVNDTLRNGGARVTDSRVGRRWSGALLVVELALGVVMLANVAFSMRVSSASVPSDAALTTDTVLTGLVSLPADRYPSPQSRLAFQDAVKEQLARLPGVRGVAMASALPVFPVSERKILAEGQERGDAISVRQVAIGEEYFDVLGLGAERGRLFTSEDGVPGSDSVLVNAQLAARLFPDGNPVGGRIALVPPQETAALEWRTVVGVAPIIRQRPQAEPEPIVYMPLRLSPPAAAAILVAGDLPAAQIAPAAREALRRIDPAVPLYDVAALGEAVARAEWNARLSHSLLLALTLIAVGLAAAGLFAVINRMVAGRRREFGVRLALGASASDVARLVVGNAAKYVAYGAVAGIAAAIAWDAAFGVSARSQTTLPGARLADPIVLLAIAGVLAAVALLASLAPVRMALGVDPLAVLRQD